MYLRPIELKHEGKTIRFSEFKKLPSKVFRYALGCYPEDVDTYLFRGKIDQRTREKGYVPQRKGITKRWSDDEDEDRTRHFPDLEGTVERVGIHDGDGVEVLEETVDIGGCLDRILEQYATDILQKLGNPKGDTKVVSYSALKQDERSRLRFTDIDTLELGRLFTQVQWRRAKAHEWATSFNRLFPTINHKEPVSVAHFPSCRYYINYKNLIYKVSSQQRHEIRRQLKMKFKDVCWIPSTKADRLWDFSVGDDTWQQIPHRHHKGPKIIVNPRNEGIVTMNTSREDTDSDADSAEAESDDSDFQLQNIEAEEDTEEIEVRIPRKSRAAMAEEEEESEESEVRIQRRPQIAIPEEEEESEESEVNIPRFARMALREEEEESE